MNSDPDCNHVAHLPTDPNVTIRCTRPQGHETTGEPHWLTFEPMRPKHRKPVATDTDPFDLPRGGRHRRTSELQRRLAMAGGAS